MTTENQDTSNTKSSDEEINNLSLGTHDDEDDSDIDNISPAYVRKLRDEAKKWRLKAKENKGFENKFKEADEKSKNAEEKAMSALKQIEEIRNLSERRIIDAEYRALGKEYNLKKPEYIKLANLSGVKVREDGSVDGAREAIEALKESDPDLFATTTSTNVHVKVPSKSESKTKAAYSHKDEKEYQASLNRLIKG